MTLADVPARTLVPLEQIVHRYLAQHPGEGGTLYLPHSDWQRVKAQASGVLSTLLRIKNGQYRKAFEQKCKEYGLPPGGMPDHLQ